MKLYNPVSNRGASQAVNKQSDQHVVIILPLTLPFLLQMADYEKALEEIKEHLAAAEEDGKAAKQKVRSCCKEGTINDSEVN